MMAEATFPQGPLLSSTDSSSHSDNPNRRQNRNRLTHGGTLARDAPSSKVEPNDYAMSMNWKRTRPYEELKSGIKLGILEHSNEGLQEPVPSGTLPCLASLASPPPAIPFPHSPQPPWPP